MTQRQVLLTVNEIIEKHWQPSFPIVSKQLLSDKVGTSSHIFLINEKYILKLAKTSCSSFQVQREAKVLKKLSNFQIPLIPQLIGEGYHSCRQPLYWLVYTYIKGEINLNPASHEMENSIITLTSFLKHLNDIPPDEDLSPEKRTYLRGSNLAARDPKTKELICNANTGAPREKMMRVWSDALMFSDSSHTQKFIHGDLHPANLPFLNGKINGVIDFGCAAYGDRSCDLMAGWTVFDNTYRNTFFSSLNTTDKEYFKSKGWALTFALGAIQDFPKSLIGEIGRQTLKRVLTAVD